MIPERYAPTTYALFRIVFGFLFLAFGLQKTLADLIGAADFERGQTQHQDVRFDFFGDDFLRSKPRADQVGWIESDVACAELPCQGFDLWHDRAVFHFLTTDEQKAAYVAQVARAVRPRRARRVPAESAATAR